MTYRITLSIIFCTISIVSAHAQLTKQDSIRLKNLLEGDGEININKEIIKNIHFDFNPSKEIMKSKPMMSDDKTWMKYNEDLPKNYLDTTKWVKPKYVRLAPFTIYTKYDEDPVYDPIVTDRKDTMTVRMKFKIDRILGIKNGYRVVPQGMDQSITPSNNPIVSFSAEDILAHIFSKKARIRNHNAKHANAWKTYKKALPLKDPFNRIKDKTKSAAKDTLNIKTDSAAIKNDSILKIKRDPAIIKKDTVVKEKSLKADSIRFERAN